MTTPALRLDTAAWRIIVGLFAVAVVALLAPPPASASPESDADAAISAAWDASGGDGGPLGPREGGVYAAGAGFAQNLANGKIFFTPDTGAHYVQGAILEKYESLGGPADSDLGFPTIDEGAGRAPDSRNSTFSASDKPVIFWTPATGARVVRGAINAAWDKLGGSAGVLGVPTEDEAYRGDVLSQKFTGGELSWDRKTNVFTTVPPELADQLVGLAVPDDPASAIAAARRAAGGDMGPLGAKEGDVHPIGNTGGVAQDFARGKIFYSPETGANAITDQVLEKYESVGGPEGDMGFPTSSETEGGLGPNSRIATFAAADKPVIFWTPDFGAVIVRGAMNAAWEKLGGATGELGAPKGDQTENGSVVTQQFNGGSISWDRSDNTFTTEPAKLASELSGLEIPGLEQAPPQGSPAAADTDEGKPFSWRWSWWWLLALIPVLVVAGLIVGAAVWHRRRGRSDAEFGHDLFDDDEYDDGGGQYDDARYRESGGYDEDGPYGGPGYDAPRYGEEERADDLANPYEDADPFRGDEPTTAHFTGQYREASAPPSMSPFDEPTDIAMPVSQWAAPGGFSAPADEDDDEQPEEAVELFGGPGDDRDDDLEEDFEDEFDDAGQHDDELVEADDRDDSHEGYDDEPHDDAVGAAQFADTAQFDNSDDVDTAPTPIVTPVAAAAAATLASRTDIHAETPSGRHAAIEIDEPVTATAIHLPLDDPQRAPQGYPIKADTKSGFYWSPDSRQYDDAVAEIWFASEEFARTNGFVRGD